VTAGVDGILLMQAWNAEVRRGQHIAAVGRVID